MPKRSAKKPVDVNRQLKQDPANAGRPPEAQYEPQPRREADDSGIVSRERNEIVEQHFKEHPEGDPAVRRTSPDRGEIPVEEVHDDGTMTVRQKEHDEKRRAG